MATKRLLRTETVGAGQDSDGEFETLRDTFDDGSVVIRTVRDGKTVNQTMLKIVAALKRAIKKARLPSGKGDDKPVLTPQMLQAKTDGAYVQNETQWPGWEQSDAIRHEVKVRAGRLAAYYSELYKRLK